MPRATLRRTGTIHLLPYWEGLPVEDALGLQEQPNLPGTMDEHPNWRRRLPGNAADLLDAPGVAPRLAALNTARTLA